MDKHEGQDLESDFWNFSVAVYGREGVARICLDLQDRLNADVNMLLFCCWLAGRGARRLGAAEIEALVAAVETWRRGAVEPLRATRRFLKNIAANSATSPKQATEELRRSVAGCELAAERLQQILLVRALPAGRSGPASGPAATTGIARGNLNVYLETVGPGLAEAEASILDQLVAGVFPELANL